MFQFIALNSDSLLESMIIGKGEIVDFRSPRPYRYVRVCLDCGTEQDRNSQDRPQKGFCCPCICEVTGVSETRPSPSRQNPSPCKEPELSGDTPGFWTRLLAWLPVGSLSSPRGQDRSRRTDHP